MVCEELEIDPVAAIAEGSLLAVVIPKYSRKVIEKRKGAGISSYVIGEVIPDKNRRIMKRRDGSIVSLAIPKQDPFWPVFFRGME